MKTSGTHTQDWHANYGQQRGYSQFLNWAKSNIQKIGITPTFSKIDKISTELFFRPKKTFLKYFQSIWWSIKGIITVKLSFFGKCRLFLYQFVKPGKSCETTSPIQKNFIRRVFRTISTFQHTSNYVDSKHIFRRKSQNKNCSFWTAFIKTPGPLKKMCILKLNHPLEICV